MANGILDMFGTDFDDPRTQGLLGLSLGLLEAGGYQERPTTLGQALARGGQMGMKYRQAALEAQEQKQAREQQRAYRELQMQQLQQQMGQRRREEAQKVQARQAATSLATGGLPIVSMEAQTPEIQRRAALALNLAPQFLQEELKKEFAAPPQPSMPTLGSVIEMPIEGGFTQKMQYGPLPNGAGFAYQPFGVPFKEDKTTSLSAIMPRNETVIDPVTKQPVTQSVAYLKPGDPRIGQLGGDQTTGRVVLQANVPEEVNRTALMTEADAIFGPLPSLEKNAWLRTQAESRARGVERVSGIVIDQNGNRVGTAVYDPTPQPGQPSYSVVDPSTGEKRELLEGEAFVGKDVVSKSLLPIGQRNTLEGELLQGTQSIRKLNSYMENVSNAKVGSGRLVDDFIRFGKTFFNDYLSEEQKKLSASELATAIARGQLQGLLGASRLEVVGGGVMTEQDALRVIQYLGGDVNALQNPEVVAAAIRRVMKEKAETYNLKARQFNTDSAYRGSKAKPYEYIDIDKMLNSIGVSEATPATGDVPEATNRFESMSLPDLRKIDVNALSDKDIIAYTKVLEKVLGK